MVRSRQGSTQLEGHRHESRLEFELVEQHLLDQVAGMGWKHTTENVGRRFVETPWFGVGISEYGRGQRVGYGLGVRVSEANVAEDLIRGAAEFEQRSGHPR